MIEPPHETNTSIPSRGGLSVETRFAGIMAQMIDPAKVSPDSFRALVRPFAMSLRVDEPNLPEAHETRAALQRFTQTLALTISKGSVQKAKQLLEHDYDNFLDKCLDDSGYVKRVNQMLSTMGMYSP